MTYLIGFDSSDFWIGYLYKGICHWRGWNNSNPDFYVTTGEKPYESVEDLISRVSGPGYPVAVVSTINPYLLCTDIYTFRRLAAIHNPEILL